MTLPRLAALAAALLVGGCNRPALDPAPDPPGAADGLHERLVGKWELTEKGLPPEGLEFTAGGAARWYRPKQLPQTGYYAVHQDGRVEMTLQADDKVKLRAAVVGDALTLHFPRADGSEKVFTYRRVRAFAAAIDHPNRRPNDQQKKWLVGGWKGDVPGPRAVAYDFYADGTFFRREQGPQGLAVEAGTYRMHPEADNFVELAFADTGNRLAAYAEVGANELLLTKPGTDVELRLRRRGPADPNFGPPKGGQTAARLYAQWKADREAAEKRHRDKELTVTGVVVRHRPAGKATEVLLLTGESQRLRCVLPNAKPLTDALRKAGAAGKARVVVKGYYASFNKEKPWEGSKGEAALVLALDRCKVAGASPLQMPK